MTKRAQLPPVLLGVGRAAARAERGTKALPKEGHELVLKVVDSSES